MFSFRQKIFITYVLVFLVFIAMIFPFAQRTVKDIVRKGMEDRAADVIQKIDTAPNDEALLRKIKDAKALIFFRVSIITNERKVLYDSHKKRILGPRFSQDHVVNHPEVIEAFRTGTGYHEEYSDTLEQDFYYLAMAFNFHGKTYVLRTAFPLRYVEEITKDFEVGFLCSAIAILLLFSIMTWFIINYLTRPIEQIISAVKPYQDGLTQIVPQIKLKPENRSDEFGQLANTLNSLSVRIGKQINTLTVERNEKEAILESLVEGVVAVNNEMIITYVNTQAAQFLEISIEDVLERPAQLLRQEQCIHLLEKCQKEEQVLRETLELKTSTEKIYLEIIAAPKKDETGAILVLQDKTEHYRIIEMRKDFIANASHELKTPITIIRGFAEALHDNPDLPRDTCTEVTGKIVRNCEKMTHLIKDLLTLTDIEHIPESRLMECNLLELAENVKTTVNDAYPEAHIEIQNEPEKDYYLMADPNLIELCLVNLVENAAKYSNAPATITISLEANEDWISIAVKDKGFGIHKSELENIFQRFYRSEKSRYNKKIGGSGLGLSIVEMIIAKHFGKITVASVEGEGSTFTVYLPTKRVSEFA